MSSGIHVLCVDDDPDIRSVTAASLERVRSEFEVSTASSGRDALARLRGEGDDGSGDVDCIVSDYDMPGMDGLEFLEAVRERDAEFPFILFTGKGSEEIASEAISAGVTDYLQKGTGTDQYAVLANRIENAVEKRRADRARRESERKLERYRTLVEAVDDPMYVLDAEGHCTIANDALCTFLGVERERLIGEHIAEFLSRESFERGVKAVRRLYEGDRESARFEFTVETDDDRRRVGEANVTALTDDDGEFAGSTAVIRDVTDRKRRERELAQYERIIELAPIALFLLDADATITWCNDEFADAFTEDIDELIGIAFPELVDRGYYHERVTTKYADEVRDLLSSSNDRERAKYEVRFKSPDGEEQIHDVHTKLLPLEDGEFAGTIHAIRDITRRRRYQRELERQNERLEEFASLVSHDLRNPLNVAQGTLELHAEDCPRADGDEIDRIRRSLGRMDDLIDHLLSLARHGRTVGEPSPVELSEIVREAWAAVETGGATLDCRVDLTIAADEGRLQALLENLFRNAVEHGSTGHSEPDGSEDTVEHGSTSSQRGSRADDTGRRGASSEPSVADAPQDSVEHGSTSSRPAADDAVEHSSTSPASRTQQDAVKHGSTSPDSQAQENAVEQGSTNPASHTQQDDGRRAASSDSSIDPAPESGADVTVTVGPLEPDAAAGTEHPQTGFYVADDGPGFESTADDIFEFGHTTVENGTGFGLAIVEGIAEAHGWTITAQNGDTGGARFEITGVTVLDEQSASD